MNKRQWWWPLTIILLSIIFWSEQNAYAAPDGVWNSKPDMLTIQPGARAVAMNGLLYVVGGSGGSSLEVYDPAGNSWKILTNLNTQHIEPALGAISGKIYVVGGYSATGYLPPINQTLEIYDPQTKSWSSEAAPQTILAASQYGVINDLLYVAGGEKDIDHISPYVSVYNPATHTWTKKADMLSAMSHATSGVINGKLYIAGGGDEFSPGDLLQIYNPASDAWSYGAHMLTRRGSPVAGVLSSHLYVAGGVNYDNSMELDTMEVYDPGSNAWTKSDNMPLGLAASAGEVIGNAFYVAGGTHGAVSTQGFLNYTSSSNPLPTSTPPPPTSTATATPIPPTPTNTPVPTQQESEFKVDMDGWGFKNLGTTGTWESFKLAIGANNVEVNGKPIPSMWKYFEAHKADLKNGLCFGMSSTAVLSHGGQVPVRDQADPFASYNLVHAIPQNASTITYLATWQWRSYLKEFTDRYEQQPPLKDVMSSIAASVDSGMKNNPVVLYLYGPHVWFDNKCTAHAVVPFAYKSTGAIRDVSVYDPNYPDMVRTLTINLETQHWQYQIWDNVQRTTWGNDVVCKSEKGNENGRINYLPVHSPPLNASSISSSVRSDEVYVGQGASVLNYSDNLYSIYLPGVTTDTYQLPYYVISDATPITLSLQYRGTEDAGMSLFASGSVLMVKGKMTGNETLAIDTQLPSLTISKAVGGLRSFSFITPSKTVSETQMLVDNVSIKSGEQVVTSVVSDSVKLQLDTSSSYSVTVLSVSSKEVLSYTLGIPVQPNGSTQFLTPNTSSKTITLGLDRNSDGTIEEIQVYSLSSTTSSQFSIFLPLVKK